MYQIEQNLIQGTSYIPISKASDIPTTKVNISCQREENLNTVGKTKSPAYPAQLRENHLRRGGKYYFPSVGVLLFFLILFMRHGYTEEHWWDKQTSLARKPPFLMAELCSFFALTSSGQTARSARCELPPHLIWTWTSAELGRDAKMTKQRGLIFR